MRHRHHLSPWQIYSDQLLLLVGAFLLITSLLLIVPHLATPPKQEGIKPKAEFLVTLSWDDNRDVDLDLWMRGPNGHIVFYGVREDVNISLDRDSRGFETNRKRLDDGSFAFSSNREVIAIRAVMPGDYLVAVSYYDGAYETPGQNGTSYRHHYQVDEPDAAIDAVIQVDKVNPTVTVVAGKQIRMSRIHEAQNVIAFHVGINGEVTMLPLPPENLVNSHEHRE